MTRAAATERDNMSRLQNKRGFIARTNTSRKYHKNGLRSGDFSGKCKIAGEAYFVRGFERYSKNGNDMICLDFQPYDDNQITNNESEV